MTAREDKTRIKRAQQIAKAVCRALGGRVDDLLSPTRESPDDAFRRHVAMYVYDKLYAKGNLTETGRAFDRDRTTVDHGLKRVRERIDGFSEGDSILRSALGEILEAVS